MKKALLVTLLLLVAIMLLVRPTHSTTTTLTGTIKDSQGNPLNGTLILQLPVPAQDTTTNTLVVNTPVTYRVVNGVIQGGTTVPLFDTATLQPQGLYYQARAYDNSGSLVFTGNYAITGASYNLGAASPTNVTTSNISYIAPATQGGNNVFTGNNTFSGGTNLFTGRFISSTSPAAATGILAMSNTDAIKTRNSGNSADCAAVSWTTADVLVLGDPACASGGVMRLFAGVTGMTFTGTGGVPNSIFGAVDTDFTLSSQTSVSLPGKNMIVMAVGAQAGNNVGGDVRLAAGAASGSGNGGNVTLTPGASPSGTAGKVTVAAGFYFTPPLFAFAGLGTPANGALVYCSDCTIANPCAGGGTGAMAKRLNGVWVCN